MRIQHNVTAMNSYRNFNTNNSSLSKNLEKLSSGYKINRAGDDAAGLAISEKMRAQITGIEGATKNAKDGISLIQTAEGALTEVHSMLNRMTTLAEQSANGTYDNEVDRTQLQKEVESLKSEIDRVADSTNYNGIKLLDGSLAGAADAAESTVTGNIEGMTLDATKAKSTIELNAFKAISSGDSMSNYDGTSVTLNMSLSDGSGKALTLNFIKNGDDLEIQDQDGKVLNKLAGKSGESGKFTGTDIEKKLKDLVTDSFRKLIKSDETLGSAFSASIFDPNDGTNGDQKLVLTAKNAGADGLTATSVDLTASKGTNTNVTATDGTVGKFFNASNMDGATKTATAIMPTVVKGTDAITAFRAEDIVLYNDNYIDEKDGHLGNADKAVFEINGIKFAIGTSNQTRTNLDADVHFISIKPATAYGIEDDMSASGKGVEIKEYVGDGKASDGTEVAKGGNTARKLNADALKQIADELAKATGVEVKYDNTFYKTEKTTAPKDPGTTFDGGEKLTGHYGNTEATNGAAVPMFTVAKKAATEGRGLSLQIGDTADDFNKMTVSVADMHTKALDIADIDISTQEGAAEAMKKIKVAINTVSDTRGGLGALQNRLDHTINNLGVMRENIQNAESLIRDTDVAEEMMTYTKNSILNQSAQSMLAQANQLPQGVMQLLNG